MCVCNYACVSVCGSVLACLCGGCACTCVCVCGVYVCAVYRINLADWL